MLIESFHKKILFLLILLAMVMLLFGCTSSKGSQEVTKPNVDSNEPTIVQNEENKIPNFIDYSTSCSKYGVNYAFMDSENKSTLVFNENKIKDIDSFKISKSNLGFIKVIDKKWYLYLNGNLVGEISSTKDYSLTEKFSFSEDLVYYYDVNNKPVLVKIGQSNNLIEEAQKVVKNNTTNSVLFSAVLFSDGHYMIGFRDLNVPKDFPRKPYIHLVYDGKYLGLVYTEEYPSISEASWNSEYAMVSGDNYAFVNENLEIVYNGKVLGKTKNGKLGKTNFNATNLFEKHLQNFLMNENNYIYKLESNDILEYDIYFNGEFAGVGDKIYLYEDALGFSYKGGGSAAFPDECFNQNGKKVICIPMGMTSISPNHVLGSKHLFSIASNLETLKYFFDGTLLKEINTKKAPFVNVTMCGDDMALIIDNDVYVNNQKIGCVDGDTCEVLQSYDITRINCSNEKIFITTISPLDEETNWLSMRTLDGEMLNYLGYPESSEKQIKKSTQFSFNEAILSTVVTIKDKIMFYNIHGEIQINSEIIGKGTKAQISECD